MTYVHEIGLSDVISKLPDISPMQIEKDFPSLKEDLFLCALGFEDRCTWIPQLISKKGKYKCGEVIYFEYSTNPEDNEVNRIELVEALRTFSDVVTPMQCDSEDFAATLQQILTRLCQREEYPKVTFDISVCSSKLLLTVLKNLCQFKVELRLVYSEADIYHPTKDELGQTKKEPGEEKFGLTRGVSRVFPSREYPGWNLDALPEAIIAFATFSPDRTKAMIAYIDENLLQKPGDRVIWVIGKPHLEEDYWRIDHLVEVNEVSTQSQSFEVSTFDYKETLRTLHRIYKQYSSKYHLNITPLGSKMQCLGIALFCCMKPDVTIMFAPPVEYNASHYSEGCKATWVIEFGRLNDVLDVLGEVGVIRIEKKA
jgi:hypothetical protein